MRQTLYWQLKLIFAAIVLLWIFSSSSFIAQASHLCGSIITPEDTVDIIDCNNPFAATDNPSRFTLKVDGEVLNEGGEVTVPEIGTKEYVVESVPSVFDFAQSFYLHDGEDYRLVDTAFSVPTETDVRQLAEDFFATDVDRELYIQYWLGDTAGENDPTWSFSLFYNFSDYIDQNFVSVKPALLPGTYTLVLEEFLIILGQAEEGDSIWRKFVHFLIPKAFAQFLPNPISTLTFTLLPEVTEPTGASSVLFLPGIQASRLYNEDGVLGTEDQLWEPNIASDVSDLAMTASGESVNDIYTRDVLDEIALPLAGTNIYKSFLNMLEDLEDEEVIADSLAFAYDWRYSLEDIVTNGTKYENEIKNLIAEVESLASSSFTGKVTVIGHSNGGLLAKVLITELERLNKENLVDKVVFVGVPQLGTPKAIGVLLHGLDQQKALGVIVDSYTTRDIIKNMPGVYSLLPSQEYFDVSGDTLITTDGSAASADVAQYGDIDSLVKLNNFVLDTEDLRSDTVSINTPSTLNSQLMQDMVSRSNDLDNWLAPTGVDVYEVVGTGVLTIKSFQYRTFPCQSVICALIGYSKPYPVMTKNGDETVVALSAEAYKGTKVKGVVDLNTEGDGVLTFGREHADLTESPTVQEFLDSIIRYPYLNETLEVPQDFVDVSTHYVVIGAHSPVDISLQTPDGKKVGIFNNSLLEEVVGSQYFELGGSSYIIIPKETEYELKVEGTATGVYSLTIDSLDAADVQRNEHVYLGASTSPQMVATFQASSTGFSNIMTDSDGDGDIDLEQTLDGELVIPLPTYTYSSLISEIKLLQLNKLYKSVLLLQVQLTERFSKESKRQLELFTLRNLETTLRLYERKKLITTNQLSFLLEIINYFRK